MFLSDEFWSAFRPDDGPGLGWVFAGPAAVVLVALLVLLACVLWELVRGPRC